jgi:hypothetical protein
MIGRKERKKGVQARMLDYSVLMFKHHRPGTDQILSFCPAYIVYELNILILLERRGIAVFRLLTSFC